MAELLASVDIGSNSCLLLIAAEGPDGLRPVFQKAAYPRPGRGLKPGGRIDPAAVEALLEALADFRREVGARGARLVAAGATQAFRVAADGAAVLERAGAALGLPCRLLPGREESRLSYLAVADRYRDPALAVLDVGGASSEYARDGEFLSLPVGAVSLRDRYGPTPGPEAADALSEIFAALPRGPEPFLVAVGGTATALAMIGQAMPDFDPDRVEGYRVGREALRERMARVARMGLAERGALPGVGAARADIILAGLAILDAALAASGAGSLTVSDRGLRYGLIREALGA